MNVQGCQLGALLTPRKEKVEPRHFPTLPYVGLEHVEAHSTRLLGTGDASEMRSSANRFYAGDVLYSRLRPYLNKVWRADRDGLCSSEFIVLPGNDAVDSDFLCYRLNALDFVVFANGLDAGDRPRVKFDQISSFIFPPFSLAAQRRIVSKLDELFSRIEEGEQALARVQKLVERYRQSVLKAAVTGELTREWREKRKAAGEPVESGAALLERILAARRAAWEQAELAKFAAKSKPPANDAWKQKYQEPAPPDTTGLPELPEGWVWASLDMIADITGGITVDAKRDSKGCELVPYLRVANVQRGHLNLDEVKSLLAPLDRIEALKLQDGDILFNEGGDIDKLGRGWVWEGQLPLCIHQNHVFRARLFVSGPWPKVLSWYTNELGRQFFLDKGKQTTNLASISLSKLKTLPVPIMCRDEADRILYLASEAFSTIDNQLAEIANQVRSAVALRQAILKSAFSGQLVQQDPNDEPASVLLEHIAAERSAARPLSPGPSPARGEGSKAKRGRKRKDARHPRA